MFVMKLLGKIIALPMILVLTILCGDDFIENIWIGGNSI